MKKEKQPKSKEPKKLKKLQFEETFEESLVKEDSEVSDEVSEEKEIIIKNFTPKERKDLTKTIQKGWYEPLPLGMLQKMLPILSCAYDDQKRMWETEECISKKRKEYLQNLYDKVEDVRIALNLKTK